MIGYLKKRMLGNDLSAMDKKLEKAFVSVDSDIKKITEWINYLHNKHNQLDNSHKQEILLKQRDLNHLSSWISYLHKHTGDVQNQVQTLQNFTIQMGERVKHIEAKVAKISSLGGSNHLNRTEPEPSSELNLNQLNQRNKFEERILTQHVRPNRKNMIIREILETVKRDELTTKQLERIIVKEKGLCGRTTFYSHLKDLKARGALEAAELGFKSVLITKE